MINDIVRLLDQKKIEDYEVVEKVPKDTICVDPEGMKVYLPVDLEFYQYDIDDFIRSLRPNYRTNTVLDRDIYILKISGQLSAGQYSKLISYIISMDGFCVIYKN